MARRFDNDQDLFHRWLMAHSESTMLGAKFRAADKEEKRLRAAIVKKMRGSKVGTINDIPAFEVGESGRDSTTVPLVKEFVPEIYWSNVITHPTWHTIKVLRVED